MSEYEVADRRYEPLKPEAVYDHGGVVPMEVDQIKGGKSKGGKGQKGSCKICGETHQGKCWFKDKESAKAKGKGKGHAGKGKGKDSEPAKEKCQICGKQNHTANKCYQRFKDKDQKGPRVQAASTGSGTGGTASSGTGGSVAALSRKEADTSPETELRATTTGVCSATAKGHGLALLDSGSDETYVSAKRRGRKSGHSGRHRDCGMPRARRSNTSPWERQSSCVSNQRMGRTST